MLLNQLFYVSKAALPMKTRTVQNLLIASRRNNRRGDITGCLLFSGSCFAQVLEGPRAVVDETLRRISLDDRHREVRLVHQAAIRTREYGQWSMGYIHSLDLEGELESILAGRSLDQEEVRTLMGRIRPDTVMGAFA